MTTTGSAGQVGGRTGPSVERRAPEDVTIDLRGTRPSRIALPAQSAAPSVLRSSPRLAPADAGVRDLELRAPARQVHLGHDVDSPLVWQRVAEAVRALAPGHVVILETRDLGELPADLIDFLRHAVMSAARRGGTLVVEPRYGPLADVLRLAPTWPDFRRERAYL